MYQKVMELSNLAARAARRSPVSGTRASRISS